MVWSWEEWEVPLPLFFGSADSKELTVEKLVSADSEGLKVAVFSVSWVWFVSVDSKGVKDAFLL
jgi:hypothetical protein